MLYFVTDSEKFRSKTKLKYQLSNLQNIYIHMLRSGLCLLIYSFFFFLFPQINYMADEMIVLAAFCPCAGCE